SAGRRRRRYAGGPHGTRPGGVRRRWRRPARAVRAGGALGGRARDPRQGRGVPALRRRRVCRRDLRRRRPGGGRLMPGPESVVAPEYLAWLRSLAAAYPVGERRGTLRHIR